MAGLAPAIPNHHPPVKVASFSGLNGADLDLSAVSGLPDYGPQEVLIHSTAAEAIVFEMFDGREVIVQVAAGETRRLEGPIVSVLEENTGATVTTGANITLVAYWRHMGRPTLNP